MINKINIDGVDHDIVGKDLTKVTYSELKTLRDNGQLTEGHLYRITDYVTTTTETNTKSAGNVFDVIVLAVSANELSHIARAIQHEGDTYFDGNDLGAWELWYDLDNDTEKYEWADATNGKGVIYRMIDEKRNDCPYDFKNILFYNTKFVDNTTGDQYYYTFSYVVSGNLFDGTVAKQVTTCHSNSMRMYFYDKKRLNKNVFRNKDFGHLCYSNTLGLDSYNNIFGANCYTNTFKDRCNNNIFGDGCNGNTFGTTCYGNTFVDYCDSNTFGSNCYGNLFGSGCSYNILRDYCGSNVFGYHCTYNTFDGKCCSNTLGDFCNYNTFGDSCTYNIFYNICTCNTLGNACSNNTFGYSCNYNTLGNSCDNIRVDWNKTSITFNDEYYDDGSGKIVPVKHPDLSTQPSILPYKFMGQYVYEQLIPVKIGDRIVSCDFSVEYPMILSAGVFGVNSFKNIDIIATKSDAMLLNTESELTGYISVKYTDGSQLLSSNGYGYGDINTESPNLIDFGLFPDGTTYIYNPTTEVLSLYNSGEIKESSIPQNLPKKKIILGEGVTSIGDWGFENCSDLTSVTIGNSVTSIGHSAFFKCANLTSITIPNSVKSIGNGAFQYCSGLTEVTIPNSVTDIGYATFRYCDGLTSVTIPNSVTSIGEAAFYYCSGLTSITIPNSVTSIGNSAFTRCSGLTSITIPNSVTDIGEYAFSSCSGLTSITSKAITPPSIYTDTFKNIPTSIPVYVPAESVDAYKAAQYWSNFTNIQAI